MYGEYQPHSNGGADDAWQMLTASLETDVRYAEDGTAEVFLKDNPSCVIETIIDSERRITQTLAAIEPAERREQYAKQLEAYRRDDPDAVTFWQIEILKNERLRDRVDSSNATHSSRCQLICLTNHNFVMMQGVIDSAGYSDGFMRDANIRDKVRTFVDVLGLRS